MAKFDVSVKQIAREALPRLIDNLVFPNLVYKETISGPTAKQGDTVSVRCPAMLMAMEFDENTGIIPESMQNNTIDVKLDHLATVDMQLSAVEAACDFDSVVRMFIEPAAAALAEKINIEGLELYKDIPFYTGTAGTTPDGLDDLAAASLALDNQRVPAGMRCAVWSPEAAAKLKQIPAVVNAEKCGSTTALRTGSIGQVFGVNHYMSQAVCKHTSGASGNLTPKANSLGTGTIVFSRTGTETLNKGDILVISGMGYVVTENASTTSDSITVKVNGNPYVHTTDTVTVIGSHTANLVFHPDAFAFITRPLQTPAGVESYVTTYNGISLRVVRGYDIKYKREILSMDVLYAFKTIYPSLAVRYLG